MKTINFVLILLIYCGNICFSQTSCNLSSLREKINSEIELDKMKQDSILIIEQLTLFINIEDKNAEKEITFVEHQFAHSPGFTFRIYILSSDSFENNAQLKLYRLNEDDSIPHKLLASVNELSTDEKVSTLVYKNNKVDDFILELSLEKNKPGCALAIFTVFPTK